jgi:hypothetical protein
VRSPGSAAPGTRTCIAVAARSRPTTHSPSTSPFCLTSSRPALPSSRHLGRPPTRIGWVTGTPGGDAVASSGRRAQRPPIASAPRGMRTIYFIPVMGCNLRCTYSQFIQDFDGRARMARMTVTQARELFGRVSFIGVSSRGALPRAVPGRTGRADTSENPLRLGQRRPDQRPPPVHLGDQPIALAVEQTHVARVGLVHACAARPPAPASPSHTRSPCDSSTSASRPSSRSPPLEEDGAGETP